MLYGITFNKDIRFCGFRNFIFMAVAIRAYVCRCAHTTYINAGIIVNMNFNFDTTSVSIFIMYSTELILKTFYICLNSKILLLRIS